MRRPARVALLCTFLWLIPASAYGQATSKATRIRILLLIDDDGPGAAINGFARDHAAIARMIRETFANLQLEDRYTLDTLQGKSALRSKVLAYYRDLKTGPNEVLLCYFSGHGCADPANGHYLDLEDGPLKRSDLRSAMLSKKTRLVVLITDCCAHYSRDIDAKGERALTLAPGCSAPAVRQPGSRRQPPGETLRHLLFHHHGLVDINACHLGKQAFSDNHNGGYFTLALVALWQAPPIAFAQGARGIVSWPSFFVALRHHTAEAARRNGTEQTPAAFALGTTGQ